MSLFPGRSDDGVGTPTTPPLPIARHDGRRRLGSREAWPPRSPAAPQAACELKIADHPIARHALTALRDRSTGAERFRMFSSQLLLILAIEAMRSMPTREEPVETAADRQAGTVLAKRVVFLSLTRHGLGLAHDLAAFIPNAMVGAVSVDRTSRDKDPEPRLHLAGAPALGDVRVILFAPIVATGLSAALALDLLRRSGATDVSLLSFVVSAQGLANLQSNAPGLTIWTAAVDSGWDAKRGPMPGIGDFGERLYG